MINQQSSTNISTEAFCPAGFVSFHVSTNVCMTVTYKYTHKKNKQTNKKKKTQLVFVRKVSQAMSIPFNSPCQNKVKLHKNENNNLQMQTTA